MKFRTLVLAATMAVFAAGAAQAGSGVWGVQGGASFPTGDLSNGAKTGWNAGVTGTWFLTPMFGVGADVVWHGLGKKTLPDSSTLTITPMQLTGHVTWMPAMKGNMMPYVQFGVGAYSIKAKIEGASDPALNVDQTKTKVGYNAGVGVNWKMKDSKFTPGLDVKYHSISLGSDKVNGSSTAAMVSVAVNLLWGMGK
jgi:hypothetical protein